MVRKPLFFSIQHVSKNFCVLEAEANLAKMVLPACFPLMTKTEKCFIKDEILEKLKRQRVIITGIEQPKNHLLQALSYATKNESAESLQQGSEIHEMFFIEVIFKKK